MTFTSGGCRDLRKYQENDQVVDAFSRLVSGGKMGYRAIIEKKVEEKRCTGCHNKLEGIEKFCPNCGTKTEWQLAAEKPIVLLTCEELEQKFKKGEETESEILAYMRDMLKIPDFTAFELINNWRKEMNAPKEIPKIDLNQFRG
ncbi:MAG: hypothetical protein KKE23_00465 [Nanoarchaeota archaeon]|nr:hypothetical protein [Nanoarchaeota archaeon]